MELLYLLCNEFQKKIELSLTSNFIFCEELFSFVIAEKQQTQHIPNFFGNKITNVTAFIGKNGVGKTSNVCKPIMAPNWLTYDFLVFFKDDVFLIFKNPSKKSLTIENKTKHKHKVITITDLGPNDIQKDIYDKTNRELKDFIRIYYSSSYSEAAFLTKSIRDDLSTSGLISRELSLIIGGEKSFNVADNVKTKDSFTNFKFSELKNQIDFLDSKIGREMTTELNMNSKIGVSYFPRTTKSYNLGIEDIGLFKEIIEKIELVKKNGLVDITSMPGAPRIILIVWSFLHNFSSSEFLKEFVLFLKRKNFNFYSDRIDFDEEDINLKVHIGELVTLLNDNIHHIENQYISKQNSSLIISRNSFSIPLEIGKKFIDIYYKAHKDNITQFNFQWNISAGEYSFLSLFSRLYASNYRAFENHYLLVIDEGDTNFHPEWSRKYLKLLIDWIPKILSRSKSIQLVLTTHSPYVLSDLPSQNVYTLKFENGNLKIEHPINLTFGANIHDLLANDFFLEDGFMGEFAKGKIQTVINLLNEKNTDIINSINQQELWNTINMIGESFLKQKLKSMFLSKFENPEYLKQELSKARAEVLRLENLNRKK